MPYSKVLLFPGLDALFNTSLLKQWLGKPFIDSKLQVASQILSRLSKKNEDLGQLVSESKRIHLVDFDRTLIVLTTLQVAIAEQLSKKWPWDLAQGCSHGDLARNVICGVTRFEDAIDILFTFSSLRKECPKGYTANVRTNDKTKISAEQLKWLADREAPVSQWSHYHATIAGPTDYIDKIKEQGKEVGLKIKSVLPYPVHSPAMSPMKETLMSKALKWPIGSPSKPMFSSVFLNFLNSEEEILFEGLENSTRPILWMQTLRKLHKDLGAQEFINVGPSNTLTSWLLKSEEYSTVKVHEAWDLLDG